jgi:hypothetical protein
MIGLVSLHTPNYQSLADFTWNQNKVLYANKHGYRTFCKTDNFLKTVTVGYEKIFYIKDLMIDNPDVEWFFWLGTDTLITNFNIRIEDRIDNNFHFIVATDGNAINADSFLVKNSEQGRALIDWIANNVQKYDAHYFREQQAMIEASEMDEWRHIIRVVQQHLINSHDCWPNHYLPGFGYDKLGGRAWWEPGDFVVHWPGSSLETRLLRMVPHYMPQVIK